MCGSRLVAFSGAAEHGGDVVGQWVPHDLLGVPGERVITEQSTIAETIELVARELEGVPPATRILG